MNRNLYRIVFNKARGIFMAVAEIANAQGKGASPASGLGSARTQGIQVQLARLKLMSFALQLTFGASVMVMPLAQAEIIADSNAPKNQQPTVLTTANGVPQVNIQTPSAAGVSRNTYSQFDVQNQGAILNNSRTNTQTQLGGWVQGNPWLATGTARVILNEVNSANPSLLRGYVEVAGDRAQVVIANPAGVTCDGCGFINAGRATLTTGTPIINGGNLDGYLVQRGAVTVQGAGLDASQTDFTDIIARAVQVNAGIWAKELKVTAGANQVSADHMQTTTTPGTGAAPAFAIDVAQLGGMYAGKITLTGTETGVGVRNAGHIGASAGEVIVTADGLLTNSGRIDSTVATRIDANSGIANSGTVYSQGDASLATRGNIDNSGVIAAQGNTTLAATGSTSRINSSAASVLGAGINPDGTLATSGNLNLTATQSVTAHGQNLAGGDQAIRSQALDLTNSQTSAQNLTLTATTGNIDASGATLAASQTLNANAAQTLRNDDAKTSANQLNLSAHDLSNVRGELVQTGNGDMTIMLPGNLDNARGRIAVNSQNLSLAAQSLTNTDGKIEHAGSGTLALSATTLSGARGSVASNGSVNLTAQTATLDAGSMLAEQVNIDAATLSSRGGEIIQRGIGDTSIKAIAKFDNTGGTLASNGHTTLTVGGLINQGGTVQAAGISNLTVSATGMLDNSALGKLNAGSNLTINAQEIRNAQGQITAGQALQTTAINAIDNSQGLIAANQGVTIAANSVNNSVGTIGSVQRGVSVTTTGGNLNNTAGRIEAVQGVNLASTGLTNTDGVVTGQDVNLDTRVQALENSRGTIAARGALDIQSGRLTNDAGLIQAIGAASINTHGQTLTNTNSGSSGGILGQSTLTLATGDLTNQAGFIGAKGTLSANSAAISNTLGGIFSSEQAINLTASNLDNRGGQVQALDDITVRVGAGNINNASSLIRSGKTLQIEAGSVTNTNTQGANQGLEGQSVNITANQIDNSSGAIRADDNLTLTGSGNLNNTLGLISSGNTAAVTDTNASNAPAKTQTITNTGGTLIARQNLSVDSASLSGDGKVLSQGDLTVKLTGDYTHSGEFQASGTATLETSGNIINQRKLLAGNALNLKAANIDNRAGAEISAGNIHLVTPGVTTNRGLIDGGDTLIETQTLNNLGTGRIYGDHLAISTTALNNNVENGTAAVIAARQRLDIGAQTIINREHALIFSAGDMAIGGSLDASKRATGQAATVNNNSATVEALGSLDISAGQINNTNEHFTTQVVEVSRDNLVEYQIAGFANRTPASGVSFFSHGDGIIAVLTPDTWSYTGEFPGENHYKYDFQRVVQETKVAASDPGQILSGGTMSFNVGTLLNDKSRVIAGGALTGNIASLNNTDAPGERITNETGSLTHFYRRKRRGTDEQKADWSAYAPAPIIQAINLTPTVYQANTAPIGTGAQITALSTTSVSQSASGPNAASVTIGSSAAISPITQVTALNGNANGGPATVIRSGSANITLPNNSLFSSNPNPAGTFLIETDPRFASYRTWLSSDYLLDALSIDPASAQKRLGDGFYEQKLVREQVAQLTGHRFLDGYAEDEAQYRALLNSGVTIAKSWNLRPGVSLTAEQMAALTSDIVWLVEKTITLSDGSTTQALVPQLYVRVQDGDLDGSGALIAGHDINLNLSGDLTNSGTIAGRNVVALTADNIKNLGGRITGNDVALAARTDLDNLGGIIAGTNSLTASAARDLNVITTTRTQTNAQGSRTHIDRVAGLYVTNPGGILIATAGRDLNLTAAQIVNSGESGSTVTAAGHNLNLGSVTESANYSTVWNQQHYRKDGSRSDIGSTIQTQGDIHLQAGNDLNAKAANVTSEQGALIASAGHNINLTTGEAHQSVDEALQVTGGNSMFSKTTTTTRDNVSQTLALGTTFSGNSATLQAGHDLTVSGSNVVATQDTVLLATNNINLEAATNSFTESHFKDEKKSGLFSSGGLSLTYGNQQQSADAKNTGTSAAASTVGSIQGNVSITAGNAFSQVGSSVVAPQGDIDIHAQKIDITEAHNASQSEQETKFKQSGLTLALTSPVISAIQTAQQMKAASSQTKDTRMQVLAAGTAALAAKSAYDGVKAGQSVKDGNLADQAGGINISLSIGGSQNQSNSVQTGSTAVGSSVTAGGNINLTASGAGKDSDITVQGSSVNAGNDITLQADDAINLLAANNTFDQHSTDKGSSASIGVGFSLGGSQNGFTINIGASGSRGKADGEDVTHTNTLVQAGNQLTLASGGDTTLKGAIASGNQVVANVGGNLNIESLQDTSTYASQQESLGASVSLCIPPICYGASSGSVSAAKSKVNGNFASVTEQSGIKAGDEGFQVKVNGNTDLKGAAIASTDQAVQDGKNSLTTATLTTTDVQNKADASANSGGIALSSDIFTQGKYGAAKAVIGNALNNGKESGSSSGQTLSAVSSGAVNITNEVKQIELTGKGAQETVASLNRDTANAQTAAQRLDVQALARTVQAEQAIKNGAFIAVVATVDDGIKKFLDPKLYKVFCVEQPCTNDQVANNQKIAELAKGISEADSNVSPEKAVKMAIEQITGPTGHPELADSVLAQSDPNRLVKIDDPVTGETIKIKNIQTIPVTLDSLSNLSSEQKAGSTVFDNGIFNDQQRAAELAQQQTPTLSDFDAIKQTGNTTGTTYLVHTDKANNAIGELVVSGIEKVAEIFGITTPAGALTANATKALSTWYGEQGNPVTNIPLNNVSQSRGTMTTVGFSNSLAGEGFYNPNLMIIANNPAADGIRLIEAGSQITHPSNISIYAPPNDPVACFVGGYICDYSAAILAIPSVFNTPYSVHSSANTGAVGSNSADVNHPFSYNGLSIDQLNAARAIQTNANLLQLFSQPPTVKQTATLDTVTPQMQMGVNAQTQNILSSTAIVPNSSRIPIQIPQDSRVTALKALQQKLMSTRGK